MSLTRSQAEELGLQFSVEGERHPADPDQEVFAADLTIDGHTERLAGKSEADILGRAEALLRARGRLSTPAQGGGNVEPRDESQEFDNGARERIEHSDVHDERTVEGDQIVTENDDDRIEP